MSGFKVCFCASVLVLVFAASGLCQAMRPGIPGNAPGYTGSCPPQPAARPVSRTVEVNVPGPCPPPCTPMQFCAPRPCCPPPCPTRPVKVQVDVVVRPETPKPCVPQRYCCENPPVFEPIFYHAAWMLKSILAAPLGLGDCMLGHGAIRQPLPPPTPVACIPCRIVPCPPPAPMCAPPLPQCMPQCQSPAPCGAPGTPVAQVTGCPPRKPLRAVRSAPIPQ
jgi:hypothetical protein